MLKSAIIGAGTIAVGQSGIHLPMTHLASYGELRRRIKLVAVAEVDNIRLHNVMASLSHLKAYENVKNMLENEQVDIVSLCTPGYVRESILDEVTKFPVKGIWCEKPLAKTLDSALSIVKKTEEQGIALQVNYWRRFIPEIVKLKERLLENEFGEIQSITGYYADTYIRNGSHLVDLVHFLVGNLRPSYARTEGEFDLRQDGPVTIVGKAAGDIPCVLQPIVRNPYNIFELDIFCQKARIRIGENGRRIEFYFHKKDRAFPHLKILRVVPETIKCKWRFGFTNALRNLIDCVENGKKIPTSNARSASDCVETLVRVSQIIEV